jgi:hypothetical protein
LAARFPIRFRRVALVLDASASMLGHETQYRRPIAVALAVRDLLCALTDSTVVITNDGRAAPPQTLIEPQGDTSLAAGLITALRCGPDAVFLISDGYENAPAGRTAEVVRAVRNMGNHTPITYFCPVFAAESLRGRPIGDELRTVPISTPDGVALGIIKAALETDVERGVAQLMRLACPELLTGSRQIQEIGVS